MKRRFPSSRWLALFLSLLLVTATACVRSKPSPTPIPTETPVPVVESDITPAGGPSTVVAVGTTPQAETSPTDETATTVEATPVVSDTVAVATPPTPVPSPPPEAAAGPSGGQVTSYTVARGDTVYSIARRFNTTPAAIIQLNNLANPDQLVVGQTLLIPGAQAGGAGAQPVAPSGGTTYIVQVGDTMFSIAQRYGTTVDAIAQANNIFNPWYIYVGQQLIIPAGTGESAPSGEGTAPSGPEQGSTYTVQQGDTLYAIALRFDTTVQALIALNNLSSFGVIYPGQVLRLP